MAKMFSGTSYAQSGDGTEIEVQWEITPGDPGCMYQRNGDPGWPPEPDDVEIVGAFIPGSRIVLALSAEDAERIATQILEEDHDDPGPDPDDMRDRRLERYDD